MPSGSSDGARATQSRLLARIADPEPRTRATRANSVAGVRELAAAEREAAAADAFGEPLLEPLELGDALVDAAAPSGGELRPVGAGRHPVGRQLRQLLADLIEREAHALREHDERHTPNDRPVKAAVAGRRPLRPDEPALLVETERRGGNAAARGDLPDRQKLRHTTSEAQNRLDFKCT